MTEAEILIQTLDQQSLILISIGFVVVYAIGFNAGNQR